MDLAVEKVGDVAIVTVPMEELDAVTTPEFKRDIVPVLEANAKVVLDLSRLRFLDSSGLGAFLFCHRQASARGGAVKLCRMSSQVRAVIELVRLHRMLDLLDTREEAVQAFHSSAAPATVLVDGDAPFVSDPSREPGRA